MTAANFYRDQRPSYCNLHLHRWAERHRLTVGMATVGQSLALAVDWTFELMQMFRRRQIDPLLPPRPKIEAWLGYYKDHREVIKTGGDLIPAVLGGGTHYLNVCDVLRDTSRYAKQQPEQFRAMPFSKKSYGT